MYVADHDPVGLLIAERLKKNIADLINCIDLEGNTGWSPKNLIVDRFAMTYDFIQEHNLLWIDNLTSGSGNPPNKKLQYIKDYIAKYGECKVEANVLITVEDEAHELMENAITGYLGDDPFEVYNDAVKEDQIKTKEAMDEVNYIERIQEIIDDLEEIEDDQ